MQITSSFKLQTGCSHSTFSFSRLKEQCLFIFLYRSFLYVALSRSNYLLKYHSCVTVQDVEKFGFPSDAEIYEELLLTEGLALRITQKPCQLGKSLQQCRERRQLLVFHHMISSSSPASVSIYLTLKDKLI